MNYIFELRNPKHIIERSSLLILSLSLLIFFVVASFFDIVIMEFFTQWLSIGWVKILTIFTYKFGDGIIPFIVLPICLTIIFNVIVMKYQHKNGFKQCARHLPTFTKISFFGILGVITLVSIIPELLDIINYFQNYGLAINQVEQIDIEFITPSWITALIKIVVIVLMCGFNVFIFYYWFKPSGVQLQHVTQQYFQPAMVLIIFTVSFYLFVTIIKHISGRPYYMNVAWSENSASANGLNPNYSIEALFKIYGWNFFNINGIGKFSEAQYHEWYQPNNFLANWMNWITIPETVWVDQGDHYWDMDFPSGHMCAYAIGVAMAYFFYFSDYYQKHQILHWKQKIFVIVGIIMTIVCFFNLMIQLFHWPTDLAFTIMLAPWMFVFALWIFHKLMHKKTPAIAGV